MSYPNKRDCEHGAQRGKCPECDLREFEMSKQPTKAGNWYWRWRKKDKWKIKEIAEDRGQLYLNHSMTLAKDVPGEWGGEVPEPGTTFSVEWFCNLMNDLSRNSTISRRAATTIIMHLMANYEIGIKAVTDKKKGV